MNVDVVIEALRSELPPVVRWAGTIAKRMRDFDISVDGKDSGNANTDALTLADLTVQELLVAALRDGSSVLRECRIEGEESTGDMALFNESSEYAITIDPIDGTKQYRDKTGNGYGVIVQLQSPEDVLYSLVYLPEETVHGYWVEVVADRIACGPDNPAKLPAEVMAALPVTNETRKDNADGIYLIGFQERDRERAQHVTDIGLQGVVSDDMPFSIYSLMARGDYAGSLIHSPNIYDFPVSMQIARVLGGDALWVHNCQPVHFHELWVDHRAGDMVRLPGIVACSDNREILGKLCDLAKDWNPNRYEN